MYDPRILRDLGRRRDVDVRGIDEMRGADDATVFALAQRESRAVLTENVADFVPLANAAIGGGSGHHGLILTSNSSFPRARASTTDAIVKAVARLAKGREDLRDQMIWLQPER